MPLGDKSKYTDKQDRKADHIAEGYEKRGVTRGRPESHASSRKGGELGSRASARKAMRTRVHG